MTKQEVDKFTGEGIAMHTDWISKIELVIRGVNSHKSLKPVSHTVECLPLLLQIKNAHNYLYLNYGKTL